MTNKSIPLKTILMIFVCLCSFTSELFADKVTTMYGVKVTKFDRKSVKTQDEYIQIIGTNIQQADTEKGKKVRFQVIKQDTLLLTYVGCDTRPTKLSLDEELRKKAAKEEDGFYVDWVKSINMKKFISIIGVSPSYKAGLLYITTDTNGNNEIDRIYQVLMTTYSGKSSKILGFAMKTDGSSITPLKAAKSRL